MTARSQQYADNKDSFNRQRRRKRAQTCIDFAQPADLPHWINAHDQIMAHVWSFMREHNECVETPESERFGVYYFVAADIEQVAGQPLPPIHECDMLLQTDYPWEAFEYVTTSKIPVEIYIALDCDSPQPTRSILTWEE